MVNKCICSGVQVLYGDLEEAICHHVLYYSIWKKYGCLPERYNWKLDAPDVKFYPLRYFHSCGKGAYFIG